MTFLAFYGVRRRTLFMFSLVLIATFFEGSRTELIAMTIGTLILAWYDRKVSNAALLPVAALAAGFFIFIAMYRIGFQISSLQGALDSLFPLFIEGTYGSYMNLQVYDLVTTGHSAYTFFLNYLVDPVVFLVPALWWRYWASTKTALRSSPTGSHKHRPIWPSRSRRTAGSSMWRRRPPRCPTSGRR